MSAYICKASTVAKAAALIAKAGVIRFGTVEDLAENLAQLNADAVLARYGDTYGPIEIDVPIPDLSGADLGDPETVAPYLGALRCLIYQCSERHVPEDPLYQAMQDAEHHVLWLIANKHEAIQNMPWG